MLNSLIRSPLFTLHNTSSSSSQSGSSNNVTEMQQPDTKWKKFQSGIMSGVATSFITQPLEVIKTTIMVNPSKNTSMEVNHPLTSIKTAIAEIWNYKDRGMPNFFRGTVIACVRQSLGFGLYTLFLSDISKYVVPDNKADSFISVYLLYGITAFCAKTAAVCVTSPLGLLKTRKEVIVSENLSAMQLAKEIIAKDNFIGLYRGTTSIVIREAIYSFIHYSVYRKLKDSLSDVLSPTMNSFCSPFLAGILAITISHPFEVIRNRMQAHNQYLAEHKIYKGPMNAFQKIYKSEGLYGYFRGYLPRLIRKPINSGVTWLLYDVFLARFNQRPL